MTRTITKTALAAGGIAGLALLLIKGPQDPEYINPRFETAVVTQKTYTPAYATLDPFFFPMKIPASYNVTLRAGECEQTFDNKQLYDTTNLNSAVPVTVWGLRNFVPGKWHAPIPVDGGCAIEHYAR